MRYSPLRHSTPKPSQVWKLDCLSRIPDKIRQHQVAVFAYIRGCEQGRLPLKRKKRFAALALLTAVAIAAATQRAYHSYLISLDYADPPNGMVLVPPGNFLMGTNNPEASQDEKPTRKRFLPAFYIDTYEVTNAEFQAFDPTHAYAEGKEDIPATGITLQEARDYAASVGKRLPTKAEWEKAARGTDGRDYPWGNEFRDGIANINRQQGLTAVGTHPKSVSPYGAHDMIGNAWEWVDDTHRDGGLLTGRKIIEREIIKGGGYSYSPYQARISYNGFEGVGSTCNDVGFRCAQDAD